MFVYRRVNKKHKNYHLHRTKYQILNLITMQHLRLFLDRDITPFSRWWLETFFIFNLTWGNDPI